MFGAPTFGLGFSGKTHTFSEVVVEGPCLGTSSVILRDRHDGPFFFINHSP